LSSLISKLFNRIRSQRGVKPSKKLAVFFFFLFVSSLFWVLNALTKDYKSEITYSVKYINIPENKVLISTLPSEFKLKVDAFGYALARYNLSKSLPSIVVDVELLYKKNKKNKFFVLTKNTKDKITKQLNSEIEVLNISPDTLFFEFADMINKKILVKPNLNINCIKPFHVSGEITVNPDSILVSGPTSILDTLKFISSVKLSYKDVNDTLIRDVQLIDNAELKYSDNFVRVNIPVDKYTENTFIVPLEVINKPENLTIQIFPNKVRLNFLVSVSQFSLLKPYNLKAYVDYNNIQNNISNKLRVSVDCTNKEILLYSVKATPSIVEYIIEK